MTLVMGVGQGGCNLAAEMASVPNAKSFLDVFLVNSTMRDMVHIKHIPRSRWIGVNETDGLVPLGSLDTGLERHLTGGMGKDPKRCFTTLTGIFDRMVGRLAEMKETDGFDFARERFALLLFSGAGGTGSGAAPVLARALREVSENRIKVVGVVILPVSTRGDDDAGALRDSWNCWYSIQKSLQFFDGLILVDNDRLAHMGDIERAFPRFNQYVARTLTDMVLGNLTELVLPQAGDVVLQQNDTQDLVTALSLVPGKRSPGVAGIGRAVQMLQSPLGYVLPFLPYRHPDLVTLTHLARERLTLREPEAEGHEKAFVLIRAPRRILNGTTTGGEASEAISSVSHARCSQIVYGTALTRRPLASITLGLTYRPEAHPRLRALEERAQAYESEVQQVAVH